MHHAPLRSSPKRPFFAFGHNWVVFSLDVWFPFAAEKVWAIPAATAATIVSSALTSRSLRHRSWRPFLCAGPWRSAFVTSNRSWASKTCRRAFQIDSAPGQGQDLARLILVHSTMTSSQVRPMGFLADEEQSAARRR
jgi:hypothetical protein